MAQRSIKALAAAIGQSPVQDVPPRAIKEFTRFLLAVRAGGRCELDGCNKYLFRHSFRLTLGNFSQTAHIVGYSDQGPRGGHPLSAAKRNDIDNLMLLCPECHHLIDSNPMSYPVSALRAQKAAHESRIFKLTEAKPEYRTRVLLLRGRVQDRPVAISQEQVQTALGARYPDPDPIDIDLTAITDTEQDGYVATMRSTIDEHVARLANKAADRLPVEHISVFALAPIPLLVYLGSRLSDKIPTDLYQRHRTPETWVWQSDGTPAEYSFRCVREGTDLSKVALMFSLSGTISPTNLPSAIDAAFFIYEITLSSGDPTPAFLRQQRDLLAFQEIYQLARRTIMRDHPTLYELHILPAVPPPVAVAIGRDVMQKVDPALVIYDYSKKLGGFHPVLRIND